MDIRYSLINLCKSILNVINNTCYMQSDRDPWSLAVICFSIPLAGIVCLMNVELNAAILHIHKKCTFTTSLFFLFLFSLDVFY